MFYAALVLVLCLLINGTFMLVWSAEWYQFVPGANDTGPYNGHFIKDIGFIFILCGVGLSWRLIDTVRGKSAAIMAAAFLVMDAGYHFYETLVADHHGAVLISDVIGVYVIGIISIFVALIDIKIPTWFQKLFTPMVHKEIAKFESTFQYDAGYMHNIASEDLEAITRFSLIQEVGQYRKQIPLAGWYAAKLVSCISEDCGPCTQLVIKMAEKEGVESQLLTAILKGERDKLDPETGLYFDFANALISHAGDAETYRKQIVLRYGELAAISVGLAMVTAKAYPLMKYALGYGKSCAKIDVSGETCIVNKTAFLTAQ